MDNKLLPKLSQNLLEILDDDEYYDITVEVGNDPYVKIFRAHMVILNYRSSYLRRILSINKKKNDGTLTNIKLPNISPEIFQIVLRYIYGGKLSLEEYDITDIIKILITANELNLQELISYLELFLIKNKTNWIDQNFDLIYQTSFENDSFLELQKYCIELISKEPNKIFNSTNLSSISEKVLISLIQHDNLQMSQIQIWENILKWGIAQNPELSSDPSIYSDDDFNALKNTLQKYIPFVKFTKFTYKEFLNKVYPYKKIIPEELFENLVKYFLDYDRNSYKITVEKEHSIAQHTLESGESTEQDSERTIYQYSKVTENGCEIAQYNLGSFYRYGKGVEKNDVKAFECYEKSADQGYLNAQFELGYCYSNGIGTEVNKAKAFEYYKLAAEKGHNIAQNNLGILYEYGAGTEKDLEQAIYWYNKAAENKNNVAQYNLGLCYRYGIGVEKNEAKSFEYYKTSADQGNLKAQYRLGYCYENGIGTNVNRGNAFAYYKRSADQGYLDAQFQVGYCYYNSIGVRYYESNMKEAFKHYKLAAEKGHINAQNNLGILYENGEGTEKNSDKAIYWFQKAAENRNK
ncbi:hypothetical protein C1645_878102 [Glomus cerebriforme]|uniref:BTB domain-containing protein n=1 Tax=Glomus cerebriforme TaxID=658196 RepID=A0A397STI2_9GLOM|nr:hypothetical protein C1645_878102 [Glomus cerebriforme]